MKLPASSHNHVRGEWSSILNVRTRLERPQDLVYAQCSRIEPSEQAQRSMLVVSGRARGPGKRPKFQAVLLKLADTRRESCGGSTSWSFNFSAQPTITLLRRLPRLLESFKLSTGASQTIYSFHYGLNKFRCPLRGRPEDYDHEPGPARSCDGKCQSSYRGPSAFLTCNCFRHPADLPSRKSTSTASSVVSRNRPPLSHEAKKAATAHAWRNTWLHGMRSANNTSHGYSGNRRVLVLEEADRFDGTEIESQWQTTGLSSRCLRLLQRLAHGLNRRLLVICIVGGM